MNNAVRALALLLLLPLLLLMATNGAQAKEPLSAFPRSTLTARTAKGEHTFDVWLADTAPRRAQGLMFVKKLPRGSGMLFTYGGEQTISMWMKNTFVALDMIFIAADGRITRIARDTVPHSLDTISSMGPVRGVLEIGAGESERLGIEVGDRIVHPALREGSPPLR